MEHKYNVGDIVYRESEEGPMVFEYKVKQVILESDSARYYLEHVGNYRFLGTLGVPEWENRLTSSLAENIQHRLKKFIGYIRTDMPSTTYSSRKLIKQLKELEDSINLKD